MRKMIMAVVSRDQANPVIDSLINAGYGATFTDSRGGVLQQAQQMVFVAADVDKVDEVLAIIQEHCRVQVEVGGGKKGARSQHGKSGIAEVGYAVVFVWDLDRFETY